MVFPTKHVGRRKNGLRVIIAIVIILLIGGLYIFNSGKIHTLIASNTSVKVKHQVSAKRAEQSAQLTEANNLKSVVNIGCDNGYGGSGTIWTNNGIILTNNHVIKGSTTCLITIPNPTDGSPTAIYTAIPLIVPDLSQLYDLAALQITGSYTDSNRKIWGVYPTTFPAFTKPFTCKDAKPQLGDTIRLYGYPVTSGDYNLTITDGIISNFTDNGDILTSAKVDSGNSGGLAINQQTGCMVGIPSAVESGNYQNLGVIIPVSVISDFLEKGTNSKYYAQPTGNAQEQNSQSTNEANPQYVVSDNTWKFSLSNPSGWFDSNFDDSSWITTQAPSDGQCPANAIISSSWINENGTLPMSVSNPNWTGQTGYFRKTFNLNFVPSSASLKTLIDYDGSIYINGQDVFSTTSSPNAGIHSTTIDPATFVQGTNVINVVDNGTGQCQGAQVELTINP